MNDKKESIGKAFGSEYARELARKNGAADKQTGKEKTPARPSCRRFY